MSRTGYLVVGALVFALAAAGVLVWTNYLEMPGISSPTPSAPSTAKAGSSEAQLVALMSEAVASGGVAATLTDKDLPAWRLGPGHKLERYSLGGSSAIMGRLTSTTPLDASSVDWHSTAATFTLPLEFAQRTSGKKIEIGVIARSPGANAAPSLYAVYATQQAGNSGWKALALTGEFQLIKFSYDVPGIEGGYQNSPIIAFHSDPQGAGHAVEILGAFVRPSNDQ